MKIGIFGTGAVGQVLSDKLHGIGHEVMIGTRNPNETLNRTSNDNFGRPGFSTWHQDHPDIRLGTFARAAEFGEMLINATNGNGALPALRSADVKHLAGKVLIDISNPLDFSKGFPPLLSVSNTDSLGEQLQRTFPEVKVVKTLNTMNAYIMVDPGALQEETNVFISGNDTDAKQKVKDLLGLFGWKSSSIIDLGDITSARGTEQILPLWTRLYGTLQNGMFNFKIVQAT